jgi:hypothetical protein
MEALALGRRCHRQTQKIEPPLLQDCSPSSLTIRTEQKKPEQNEEKFCLKRRKKKSPPSYPVFKPVSLPDFQIGDDTL